MLQWQSRGSRVAVVRISYISHQMPVLGHRHQFVEILCGKSELSFLIFLQGAVVFHVYVRPDNGNLSGFRCQA